MLKKHITREPEGNVVPADSTVGATVAVAGVIHQDVDPARAGRGTRLGRLPPERRGP